MQFSNVDGSLVKQKIPVYKLYSYEEGVLAFYFPDLWSFCNITKARDGDDWFV